MSEREDFNVFSQQTDLHHKRCVLVYELCVCERVCERNEEKEPACQYNKGIERERGGSYQR